MPRAIVNPRGKGALLALFWCAFLLRVLHLDRESLWVDEAFTVANARLPLDLIWTAQVDVHPPLYNTLMHAWLAVAGTSEFALRLPSALVSLTIVAGAYQAGRRLGGGPAAWTAALLAALSPTQLWYAQEGRNYALMMAMLSLGAVAYLDALRGRPSSCWRYVLPTVGAVLSNHSALGALAAQHLAAIPRLADADFRRWWLRAQALVAGLLLPWLAVFASQYEVWKRGFWLPWTRTTPPHRLLVDWWAGYAGWQLGMQRLLDAPWGPLQLAMLATMVLLAVLGVAGLLPRRAERTPDPAVAAGPAAVASPGLPIAGAAPTSVGASLKPWSAPRAGLATRLFLALGTILPAVLALVADHLNPNYHLRFTLAGHPVVLLLVAVGVTRVGQRTPIAAGALLLALLTLWGVALHVTLTTSTKENWRSAVRALSAWVEPGDVVLASPKAAVDYYYRGTAPVYQVPPAIELDDATVARTLDRLVAGARRVWLIPSDHIPVDPFHHTARLLGRHAERREERWAGMFFAFFEMRPGFRIEPDPPLVPTEALFGGALRLTGYLASDETLNGEPVVRVVLGWTVEEPPGEDLKVFAHLHDEGGQTLAQSDPPLDDGTGQGSAALRRGQAFQTEIVIPVPRDVRCRATRVAVGLYRPAYPYPRLEVAPPEAEQRVFLPLPPVPCARSAPS
ncbi:MAG TPA: glycosyltransferase family 39 protein [Chloroflexota bacterium]